VPWLLPLGDGLCSNIGTAPRVNDAVVINLGTSAAVRALVRGPRTTVPRGLWEYRVTPELSLLGGALSNGGNVAVWMRETLTHPDDGEIDRMAGAVRPDAHGLTVLPFFAGERSPGWNDAARATIHGLGLHTRPADILRASMEAVAYRLAAVYDLLQPAVAGRHSIAISGGGFRQSAVWSQIVADVLGRPVLRSAAREATSRGAAIWAMHELAIIESWDAVEAPGGELIQPDIAAHPRYRGARARQQDLYERLARLDPPDA
jgi:gluconokinase